MRRMKRMMSVLASMVLVLAMAIPVSAEERGAQRVAGTVTCTGCGATATFSRYGKTVEYYAVTGGGHGEKVEAIYYCSKGHTTVGKADIGIQSHTMTKYDDLGHTASASNTHQYWVKCPCGYGENYYVDCNYNKTGVHTKPF